MSQPPAFALPDGLSLHLGWKAGLIGWIVRQHGLYYAQNWQLGSQFEAIVAQALGEFMLRYDPSTDRLISLYKGGEPVASLTLDGGHERVAEDGARIRFVIIDPNWQSQGLGGVLMSEAMRFLRETHMPKAYLTTFKGLEAARKLYERFDFQKSEEHLDTHWGVPLFEQKYIWQAK
jgi:GNAT superfamily N-acetyltransferase